MATMVYVGIMCRGVGRGFRHVALGLLLVVKLLLKMLYYLAYGLFRIVMVVFPWIFNIL